MYVLERPERKGDRARTKLHTPSGAVDKVYADGMVTVSTESDRVKWLLIRLHGFVLIDEPAPEPAEPPAADEKPITDDERKEARRVELKSYTVTTLRKMASGLKIKGRSKMNEDALVQAILTAEG